MLCCLITGLYRIPSNVKKLEGMPEYLAFGYMTSDLSLDSPSEERKREGEGGGGESVRKRSWSLRDVVVLLFVDLPKTYHLRNSSKCGLTYSDELNLWKLLR